MNRYWDYTEQERANMTRGEVDALCKVELMEKGVANVPPLEVEEVLQVEVEKRQWFGIEVEGKYSGDMLNIVFATAEDANAFLALNPMVTDSDWQIGSEYVYAKPSGHAKIVPRELYVHQSVLTVKSQLEEREATKKRNEKLQNAYSEASKKVTEATSGVWEDWRECQQKKAEAEQVSKTLSEYADLCNGDLETAKKFLHKAYDEERLSEWGEWMAEAGLDAVTA